MHWTDDGIILAARPHGERQLILQLLTRQHGRHAGMAPSGRKQRGSLQPGALLQATWSARLADHLGTYRCDVTASPHHSIITDPAKLAALVSACALLESTLPERDPHPALYEALIQFLDQLTLPDWQQAYVRLEFSLLAEMGFGLDLSCCAATGTQDALHYVSPKSGRAVSEEAAAPWKHKLLPLPAFLRNEPAMISAQDISDGLTLTGFFLHHWLYANIGRSIPPARERMLHTLQTRTIPAVEPIHAHA
ncbi:MAG: DNA repair protein RecO [Rickettsiales bacterium]|nr:DNA repair protein RecO [Rickettsiales bacterium]